MENRFVTFLDLLKVRHTKSYSNQTFNEHPHKNNLYGLSKMLSDYNIRNAATKIEDKENDIFNIECQFVAYSGGDFMVVEKVEAENAGETGKVHFIRNGKKLAIPVLQFK